MMRPADMRTENERGGLKKLIAKTTFPANFKEKVDMSKVNMNGMGGLSGGGFGGLNMGMGGNKMTDAQMRTMARAMSDAGKGKFDQNIQVVSGDDGERGVDEPKSVSDEA